MSNDCRNLLMLCRVCHDRTLADASACIELGWVIERRSGVDPYTVPALMHTVNGRGWWLLTEDGGYDWDDEANLAWSRLSTLPGYEPTPMINSSLKEGTE